MPTDVSDLLAVAFVRRTLMELGFQLNPDAMGSQPDIGAIELWIHLSRVDLDGLTPLAVMRFADGQARIRSVLEALVTGGRPFEA